MNTSTELPQLEHRRRAIANALSAATRPPLKPSAVATDSKPAAAASPLDLHAGRVDALERAVAELRLQVTHAMRRIDELEQPEAAAYPPGETESEPQRPRLMSDAAAVALFGHV